MGVATVLVTYLLARRVAGPGAGLLAGSIVATTPISVAVDRDNLPDTALVLLLVLAAWAMSRAGQGRLRSLLLAVVLVGLAFNVKMLAAFIVLPTICLACLLSASHPLAVAAGAPGRCHRAAWPPCPSRGPLSSS